MTNKESKQKYYDKLWHNAKEIDCACGCGNKIKEYDRFGRKHNFVNGHNDRKYFDPKQHKREWNHRNREQRYKWKKSWGHKRKQEAIKLHDSKCNKCGYLYDGKNGAVFHFHHLEPIEKKFTIGNQYTNKSWESILEELKKCIMLCAICHTLEHSEEY